MNLRNGFSIAVLLLVVLFSIGKISEEFKFFTGSEGNLAQVNEATSTQTNSTVASVTPSQTVNSSNVGKFQIGETIATTSVINIRETPGGLLLGQQPANAYGTIMEGPYLSPDGGMSFWNVDFVNSPDGWAIEKYLVSVSTSPTPPTVTITANPSSVVQGSSSTLTWSSTDATSCVASGNWTGNKNVSGSQAVTPTTNSTYTLTCTGLWGASSGSVNVVVTAPPPSTQTKVPLIDMGTSVSYHGFTGGLYENGTNEVPTDHSLAGMQKASLVVPRDVNGNPDPNGKVVLLSIGFSNVTQEWCSHYSTLPCDSWTFTGQALAHPNVNKTSLYIANGAAGTQVASTWDSPTDTNYTRVLNNVLTPVGLSEKQVQVVWLKAANSGPTGVLPSTNADAYKLVNSMGKIVRALKTRYPNLQQVFFSSRIYAGNALSKLNPEPFAYENGFAVKWLIQAQVDQKRNGKIMNSNAGNLNYNTVAPWIAWGPYLWADGTNPRSDGLVWLPTDFERDGVHPNQAGEQKVGSMLLDFFLNSQFTPWFRQ